MSGKGSKPRPFSVSLEEYESNWERAFGKMKHDVMESAEHGAAHRLIQKVGDDGYVGMMFFTDKGATRDSVARAVRQNRTLVRAAAKAEENGRGQAD